MAPGLTMSLTAHAKVNLALAVGPPVPAGEPDAGMHPIASWMHAIELGDEIEIGLADADVFDITWHHADDPHGRAVEWSIDDDLGVRAVCAMRERGLLREHGVSLRVRKHVPAGGGLGGGSGDAGAVLGALAALVERAGGTRIDEADLHEIAASLGSDVAFFVDRGAPAGRPRPALVGGLGGVDARLARRDLPITLVFPPFGCPTGAVYRAYDDAPRGLDAGRVRAAAGADPIDQALLFNDLQAPACAVEPRLAEVVGLLDDLGCRSMVSGSGSTVMVFGGLPAGGSARLAAAGCTLLQTRLI